jgi:hypothetical protein
MKRNFSNIDVFVLLFVCFFSLITKLRFCKANGDTVLAFSINNF